MGDQYSDRRRFKRTEGVLYFSCQRIQNVQPLRGEQLSPEKYGFVQVMLESLSSYIDYTGQRDADVYKRMIRIIEEINREMKHSDSPSQQIKYYKQPAIISGEAFEYATHEQFQIGDRVQLNLCFTIYPFASVAINTKVFKIKPHNGIFGDKLVVLLYDDIPIDDQEVVVKYVATRERELIRQKREVSDRDVK